jgi:transcriptional regulator with XRE-family HTH domain
VSGDPAPELATNEEWRAIAVRRRKELGWTQEELGRRVGTSQNMISLIESGKVEASAYVAPICKELSIPFPTFYENEDQRVWSQMGHVLRNKNLKQFRRALELVRSMVEDEEAAANEQREPSDPPPRK